MHYFPPSNDQTDSSNASTHESSARDDKYPSSASESVRIDENTDISKLSNTQLHELNQNLLNESTESRPLIGEIEPMTALREEYERGSPSFVQQIDWLKRHGYYSIRRTRGDGDCFYRSVAFAYVERILHAPDLALAVTSAVSALESTLPFLEAVGFQRMVFEDFYDVLLSTVKNILTPDKHGRKLDSRRLLEIFQNPEESNSIVVYMRLLTSARIRQDPDLSAVLFHPDLGELMEARQFCEFFVEAVGKEADHVQIIALAKALGIGINVAYLDGRGDSEGKVAFISLGQSPDSGTVPIILLYRPGHYDILLGPDDESRRLLLD